MKGRKKIDYQSDLDTKPLDFWLYFFGGCAVLAATFLGLHYLLFKVGL